MKLGKAILEALDAARDGQPLTAAAVHGLTAASVQPRPTLSEVDGELRRLEARGEVVSINDEDRGVLHSITAKGRARALS